MASSQRDEPGVRMRRELNVWEAIGISVALMAPSFAINANPQGMVGASAARCRSGSCWRRSASS